ncbi:hypothetical protein [Winogradskyella sp. PG-2]|uniref:hypothetical protein n=1 Tax=Winogradskyella sp. PG-2 TaxID=754409 RepID=UPI0004585E4E|nr:hypothetical protein [Winogradskyella sp. PG-2]BAO77506.1 hypothetical protein WPG_3276 [Winogradskyella sp. PG-2]
MLLVIIIVTSFAIPNWLTQARIHNIEVIALKISKDNQAFDFLMNSGKKRLRSGNIYDAYSEFKLAVAIKPVNEEVNQLLLETISMLCEENENYCNELENLIL